MLGGDASKLCKDTQSVRQTRAACRGTRNDQLKSNTKIVEGAENEVENKEKIEKII